MTKNETTVKTSIAIGAKGTAIAAGGRARILISSLSVNPTRSFGEPHVGQKGFPEPLILDKPRKARFSSLRDSLGSARRRTFQGTLDAVTGAFHLDHYGDSGAAVVSAEMSAATWRFWWKGFKFGLSGEGSAVIRLELPGFDKGLAFFMWEEYWCNPSFPAKPGDVPNLTRALLWREKDGLFGCLMPLIGGDCVTYLRGAKGCVEARVSTFNDGQSDAKAPAFLVTFGSDPYQLVKKATECALKKLGRPARARENKKFPKMLEYLGWCTWDAFYREVNARGMEKQLADLKRKRFPLGFIIVDDGWYKVTDCKLVDIKDDRVKFPGGISHSVRTAKKKYRIPYVGFWHSLTGYWYGIHPQNRLSPALQKDLIHTKGWPPAPPTEGAACNRFWETWHEWMKRQGCDFVKVDGQGNVPRYLRNRVNIMPGTETVQRALQKSVNRHFGGGIINCMSMGPDQTWFYSDSNVTRSSNDYMFNGKEFNLGYHARVNGYNTLWLSQVSWCDWDMFWSASENADYHAALRALSGGPIYVSDRVGKVKPAKLWPLMLKDARLLRCDGVGLPTPDCLFEDPEPGKKALKIMNTANGAGLIGVFHASSSKKPIRAAFKPSDIRGLQGDEFAVWTRGRGLRRLLKRDDAVKLTLKPRSFELSVVVPVRQGFAPLGLAGKIVAPKTISMMKQSASGVELALAEGGAFEAYCAKPPRRVTSGGQATAFQWMDGWLSLNASGDKGIRLKIEY